jgi:ABC-2 type transport system ATP-binding protein
VTRFAKRLAWSGTDLGRLLSMAVSISDRARSHATVDPVVLTGLTKRFRGKLAVDGLDLIVHAGSRVGLLGPNGAGKTTTLLMLLGAVSPDAGTIDLVGVRLPRHRSRALSQVGFVAGYLPLPENLTVREALTVFAGFYGLRKPKPIVDRAIERFGVGHLAQQQSRELSSGQRTLVSIVKSTLHDPALLVLDEPTASLDPDVARRVRTALLDLHREQQTTLLVTSHNMREVEVLCERVVMLSHGRVAADGAPAAIAAQFDTVDLEAAFLEIAERARASGGSEDQGPRL